MSVRELALASFLLLGGCTAVVTQSSLFPASAQAPATTLSAPPGYGLEDAMVELPGLGTVHVVRLDNPQSESTVIYSGGNMSFVAGQSATARALATATGADIILYDYPGRGGTDIPETVDALIAFGPSLIAGLRTRSWIGDGKLFVYGLSFGGAQAAGIARAAKPAGLIIESSAADISAIGRNAVPGIARSLVKVRVDEDLARFDYEAYAVESEAPILLISTTEDRIVPPGVVAAFAEQLRGRGAVVTAISVPGAHGAALQAPAAIDALRRFTVEVR